MRKNALFCQKSGWALAYPARPRPLEPTSTVPGCIPWSLDWVQKVDAVVLNFNATTSLKFDDLKIKIKLKTNLNVFDEFVDVISFD